MKNGEGESTGCQVASKASRRLLGCKQRIPSKHLELEEGVRRMRLRIQRQEALLQVLRPAEPLGAAVQAVHTLPECDNWRTRSANHMAAMLSAKIQHSVKVVWHQVACRFQR